MAYSSYAIASRGYDLSLFETSGSVAKSPAEKVKKKQYVKNNIVELPENFEGKVQRKKHNTAAITFGFMLATVIVVVIGFVIHGQVQLAELNQKIASAEALLETSKSEYVQLQSDVKASMSTSAVAQGAADLGMVKATSQQKEYISLSDGDKAQIFAEGEGKVFD